MDVRHVILESNLSLGDIAVLTAAVRDLHKGHPGKFITELRTSAQELWYGNPYAGVIPTNANFVEHVYCEYPLIHESDSLPHHFLHGYIRHLEDCLDIKIELSAFHGDIYLSHEELDGTTLQRMGCPNHSYWVIVAGGKFDFTTKWWSHDAYQKVVDLFSGRIQFIQVGEVDHHHPALRGVFDLRGKTSLRELISLIFHSDGVLCPITGVMHLAAAIPPKKMLLRPCVVVGGGREPVHWETYPGHQFHHTIGALKCCADGGCWRSRVRPIGDGSSLDDAHELCVMPNGDYAKCMTMIEPHEVASSIEKWYKGGVLKYRS